MTEHSTLTNSELHEPKDVSTASHGDVYVADGAGSGTWEHPSAHFGGYVVFDAVTPAYSHSATTSDTVVNPTFIETSSNEFTSTGTPNARATYVGIDQRDALVHFVCSVRQASGSNKDVEFLVYKNGVALEGSRMITTTSTSSWGNITVAFDTPIVNNDYFEIFIKASASTTVEFASMYFGIQAVPD